MNLDGYTVEKTDNTTDTLPNTYTPFVDANGHSVGDLGYNFIVGATLGNNGRITVTPATGIAIRKTMAQGAAAPTSAFEFVITNTSEPSDSGAFPARIVHADGTQSEAVVQFSAGKATVYLNAGETICISGMTDGTVYTVEEVPTMGYIPQEGSIRVTIADKQMQPVHFVNDDRGTGDLTITKEIVHALGSDYAIPADKIFTMQVTLSGIGTANATFDAAHTDGSVTSITTDASGRFTVSLGHDQQLEVFGLPEGTVATVVELNPGQGFAPAYWEDTEAGDGAVTVVENTVVSVVVTNTYTPGEVYPVNVELQGTKILQTEAATWNGKVFEFQLQKWNGSAWVTIATATASESNPNFDFNAAISAEQFSAPGVFYYQVIETNGGSVIDGITYDATLHTFGISVTDKDMDGQLEIDKVTSYHTGREFEKNAAGNWQIDITFTNAYNASGTNLVLDVQKALTNLSESPLVSLAGFRFGLYEGGELAAQSELSDGLGEARFILHYELADAGTHTYTLKEITPEQTVPGMQYSSQEYTVEVLVKDNGDGTISAEIVSIDGSANYETPVFTNVYDPKDTSLSIDFVSKQLTGRDQKPGEFDFAVLLDGSTVLTGTNDEKGVVTFSDKLYFDKVGSYVYTIVETGEDGNGIVLDKTQYTLAVTVTDENGQLKAEYSVLNVVGDQIVFHNTYNAQSVYYTVSGTKTLIGRVLLNDEFTFVLTQAQDASGTIADGAKSQQVRNLTDGSFAFEALRFDEAGTYYFVVSEKTESAAAYGIHYDETRYLVTVKVRDNEKGQLVIDEAYTTVLGESEKTDIAFENKYIPDPTSASIPGTKELTGKVLGSGDYKFELYESNANWEQGAWIETVENGGDGSFAFQTIDYSTVGMNYYLVKEVNGGQTIGGVTYDDTVYRVAVEITDDLKGKLNAAIHIYDDAGIPQEGVVFRNVYEITGGAQVTLNGTKELSGKELGDQKFTFELYQTDDTFTVSGEAIKTAVNDGKQFRLVLDYTAQNVGSTYCYVVRERSAGQTIDGITYSNAEYRITVEVYDNGTGGIGTRTGITGPEGTTNSLDFVNTYAAAGQVPVELEGTKTLTGRELAEGEFSFELYQTDDTFAVSGDPLRTAKNAASGSITFPAVSLSAAGAYYFVALENSEDPLERVTYDTARYHITVTVADDLKGNLYLQSVECTKVTDTGSEQAEGIAFTNIYTPKPQDLPLSILVDKTVKNLGTASITPEGFRFLLENLTLGGTEEKTSDAEGKAQFDLLFTEEDIGKTYTYKLTEINDGKSNVTYSTAAYNIAVTILLNENNELVAQISNNGAAVTELVAAFENVYEFTPPSIPQLGDPGLALWVGMMAVSGGGLLTITTLGRKKKDEE